MFQWLTENKEWFFSGAGIFIISCIISFFSIILTLLWKSHLENKKIRKLSILKNITKFDIPIINNNENISAEHIKVSYKGVEYDNLCLYTVQIRNIGHLSIENQKIHLIIPITSKIIEIFENKNIESLEVENEQISNLKNIELIHKIKRLEYDDTFTISYLLNIENMKLIQLHPRGIDNINYIYKDEVSESDIEKLIIYFASFIFVSIIPFIGNLIQALIVILATPNIINLIQEYKTSKNKKESTLNINGDIIIDQSGELRIKM